MSNMRRSHIADRDNATEARTNIFSAYYTKIITVMYFIVYICVYYKWIKIFGWTRRYSQIKKETKNIQYTPAKQAAQPSKGNWFCFLWKRARVTTNIFYVFLKTESAKWKKIFFVATSTNDIIYSEALRSLFSLCQCLSLYSLYRSLYLSVYSRLRVYTSTVYTRMVLVASKYKPVPYANASHRIRFHIQMCRCTNYPIMLHTFTVRLVG